MKQIYLLCIVCIVCAISLPAAAARAAETDSPDAAASLFPAGYASGSFEIDIQSGTMEYSEKEGVYHIHGGAVIGFRHFTIETDSLDIDMENRVAKTDNPMEISMDDGRLRFFGESLLYDFGENSGSLSEVRINVEGVNFHAKQVDIKPDGKIIMKEVVASTCCLDNMDYHVEARTVELSATGRAKFTKLALYFKNRRLLRWPSYSTGFRSGDGAPSGMDLGNWVFSPPSLGYSDYGGVEIDSDVQRTSRRLGGSTGLYVNYYASDGFFPEIRQTGNIGELFSYTARFGKQYKENTGYFRYFGPVIVWNYPSMEITKNSGRFPGTKIEYGGSVEVGEMKEEQTPKTLQRAFLKGYARFPLNSRLMKTRWSLIGDGRFGMYEKYRDYKIWGSGVEMEMGDRASNFLRLQFLDFRDSGGTPFYSDLVSTSDKIFAYGQLNLDRKYRLMVDAQYDKANTNFDEIVYSAARTLECLRFNVSWQTERKSVGLRVNVLNLGGLDGKEQ